MAALMYLCVAQPAWGAVAYVPAIMMGACCTGNEYINAITSLAAEQGSVWVGETMRGQCIAVHLRGAWWAWGSGIQTFEISCMCRPTC